MAFKFVYSLTAVHRRLVFAGTMFAQKLFQLFRATYFYLSNIKEFYDYVEYSLFQCKLVHFEPELFCRLDGQRHNPKLLKWIPALSSRQYTYLKNRAVFEFTVLTVTMFSMISLHLLEYIPEEYHGLNYIHMTGLNHIFNTVTLGYVSSSLYLTYKHYLAPVDPSYNSVLFVTQIEHKAQDAKRSAFIPKDYRRFFRNVGYLNYSFKLMAGVFVYLECKFMFDFILF